MLPQIKSFVSLRVFIISLALLGLLGLFSVLSYISAEFVELKSIISSITNNNDNSVQQDMYVAVSNENTLNNRILTIGLGKSKAIFKLPEFERLVCIQKQKASPSTNELLCVANDGEVPETLAEKQDQKEDVAILRPFVCTEGTLKKQADSFVAEKETPKPSGSLGCGQLSTLDEKLATIWDASKHPLALVNIGANKGYNLVEWMERWQVSEGVSPLSWGKYLIDKYKPEARHVRQFCGSCENCHAEPLVFRGESVKWNGIHIYALEPSITNYKLLLEMKQWCKFGKLTLLHAAASNISGVGLFPVTPLGYTLGSLSDTAQSNSIDVRIYTVDEFMEEHNVDHIHYLKVDTEGYDPLVLSGARKAFGAHKIELIEFEYHYFGPWNDIKLQDVVSDLNDFGYDCFLELWKGVGMFDKSLVLLTGCWHDAYEFHQWSNVLCSSRKQVELTTFLRNSCTWL